MTATRKQRRTFAQQTSAINDATGPLGIRLIIQTQDESVRLRSPRPSLILPLEATIVEVTHGSLRPRIDRSAWLLVPAETSVVLSAKSLTARTVVLTFADTLVDAVVRSYAGEIDAHAYASYMTELQLLPRTNWVNEVCHRYLFERAACQRRDNDATRFLEMELVKEIYFLCHERKREGARPSIVAGRGSLLQAALRHLETNLFDANVMHGLAKASGASASTLLRAFKRELGESPLTYLRTRRLDEALLLLKSGRYTVGEISMRVGYQNLSAFSSAFRARFGVTPSAAKS